jgi:uroporphyrinogen decarboxylase
MRQAGRYLPEYRALRATTPDFISFCLDPKKAAEATLQPMRRFPLDAAIVFADILLIPRALGQAVRFEAGEGPILGPLPDIASLEAHIPAVAQALSPVGETLERVRRELEPDRTLIGFAGAPWTVLTYMLGARGEPARGIAYSEPRRVERLLDVLVQATAEYLAMQVHAGAEVLVLFESWAEGLSEPLFDQLVIAPHRALLRRLRAAGVTTPVIGFPRGAGALVESYADRVQTQGVALDTQVTAELGRQVQSKGRVIQGALDPWLLRAGGDAMLARVDQLIEQWRGGPHIFNLGHGVLPDTPVFHVEQVVARVNG